jgi:uncharacterized protein YidB (DUF937 family)
VPFVQAQQNRFVTKCRFEGVKCRKHRVFGLDVPHCPGDLQHAVTGNAQGGNGGLADLIGMVSNNPDLLKAATSMLGNDGSLGGLEGLVSKFQQAGLGDVIGSWIGSGANQAISADQLTNVLGSDALAGMASKLGLDQGDVAGQLSQLLPGLVDKLTPAGQAPAGGLGNAGDLMGALGALLKG